ncbi:transcriptional regulator [Marivirga lumbricoides]|uniref:Transcriptional regulator n=1 Tax=Marivirga lumbricoides TaxID=1046115 RepID=A0A2T4DU71_9BACT|nr:transcriptional regulator [Marivirga lumbricoides]GGC48878.1 transcriptional regulator [Marivirga lumbricoides]
MKNDKSKIPEHCKKYVQGVKDTQDLMSGKWKTVIIAALYNTGKFRFMELVRHIEGISPKMLSQELKDLEANNLIKRKVVDTMPIAVEYELTSYGKSLGNVVDAMSDWGMRYRKAVFAK